MRWCPAIVSCCLLFAVSVPALADDIFTLSNSSHTITFDLPASPASPETTCGLGAGFCFNSVSLTVDGAPQTGNVVVFDNGGLSVSGNYIYYYLIYGEGPALFTGTPAAPTFAPGEFDVFSSYFPPPEFTGPFTLTIEPAATATPEPSSLILLGSGALGLVGILRRRLTQS